MFRTPGKQSYPRGKLFSRRYIDEKSDKQSAENDASLRHSETRNGRKRGRIVPAENIPDDKNNRQKQPMLEFHLSLLDEFVDHVRP